MAGNIDKKEAAIGTQFGIKMLDAETECEANSAVATAQARAKLAFDIAQGGTRGTRWPPGTIGGVDTIESATTVIGGSVTSSKPGGGPPGK